MRLPRPAAGISPHTIVLLFRDRYRNGPVCHGACLRLRTECVRRGEDAGKRGLEIARTLQTGVAGERPLPRGQTDAPAVLVSEIERSQHVSGFTRHDHLAV